MTETGTPQEAGRVRSVKSAERTIALLEYLSAAESARSLRDVTSDMAIPRASAYALLMTLVRTGWVEPDETGSGFRLGIRALRAGASYVEHDDVVRRAQPVMNDLSDKLGETIHLARLDGHEIVYLATCPSRHSLAVVSKPGRRLPCWATGLGKAILAQRPWPEVDALLPETLAARTERTITDRARLKEELVEVAQRGNAVDEQESTLGLRCFALPLRFGSAGTVSEALSCSIPLVRLDPAREQMILDALRHARDRIVG
ncbi:IclR family transcriptional regulator [Streptomyces sp. N2-109]|uniref:IclR family transcriptional regulator n=1 Tax=Streptomyces gossypii TaxID=2883101 RepID=A0ABT2K397_9ACTN|nr:IclR family transcriptional regulator [Streptomyces gossypii]MCT2594623.1 IclR family transcriptional regulator [Streptomyces gossypii]